MKLKGIAKAWLGAGVLLSIWGLAPLASAGESEAIASNASELVFLTWTVLASSEKKGLAADFVDFVNQPSRAARNAMFVQYATPNAAAEPLGVLCPSAPKHRQVTQRYLYSCDGLTPARRRR